MKNVSKALGLIAVIAVLFIGCAPSIEVLKNPNTSFPIDVTDEAPAFVFPISLHIGGGADIDAIGLGITGALASEFGASVISGQQLIDLVGNLSWSLGENMRRKAQDGSWVMDGYCQEDIDMLVGIMDKILGMLSELGLLPEGYQFKYIIVLHADVTGSPPPAMRKFVAFGGVYEIATNEILVYMEQEVTVADVPETMLAQIPLAFVEIVNNLLTGGEPPAEEEEM